jgi:hypothetical protein
LNNYVRDSKANYEAASPDEKQSAAASFVTARLIDLVGRLVLKSTSITAVGDESHAWVQQYVKECKNPATRQAK